MAVRPYGRVVLMGGVGMLGGSGLELPYPWIMRNCVTIHGVWLCPPDAATRLIALAAAARSIRRHQFRPRSRQRGRRACGCERRPVQDDGVEASTRRLTVQRTESLTPSEDTQDQAAAKLNGARLAR
jgi:hypothetical protein